MRISQRFKRYLIVYETKGDDVSVLRVLHGAMDIEQQLTKSDLS